MVIRKGTTQDERFETTPATTGLARAVNGLGRRFHPVDGEPYIASGAGLWVVLAALLAGAEGGTADELEEALGIDRRNAARLASEMTAWLQAHPGTSLAAGLWSATADILTPDYVAALDRFTTGPIPPKAELDRWAAEQTEGAIPTFPLEPDPETIILIASAILAQGRWNQPFEEGWDGGSLRRIAMLDDSVGLIAHDSSLYSRVIVTSQTHLDVHLVAGDGEADAADVVEAGFAAVDGRAPVLPGTSLEDGDAGGALQVRTIESMETQLRLSVAVPAFTLRTQHDLLARPSELGLAAATSAAADFSSMSDHQPIVSQGVQSAMIEFGAEGFRAAAVTAMDIMAGSAMRATQQVLLASVNHDGPFAVFVVERAQSMVLFHGWVDPAQPG
ncbi:MAG: serpin family protein [Actinomycetota bacterium]